MDLDSLTIARAQRGDAAAQARVLSAHTRVLRHLAVRLGGEEETEDLLQGLYERVLMALPRFRIDGGAALTSWVYSVAHNWLVSRRRRPKLRWVPLDSAPEPPDAKPSPEGCLDATRATAALFSAIERLPEAQRRVFVLAQLEHEPLEAIANAEGVAVGTIKSRLHRARAALVLMLGDALDAREEGGRAAADRG